MTNHEAEARPRRFTDQRGIALQTVIIMVVLLAIAGGVAAVLFSRANEATEQLEDTEIAEIDYLSINSYALCKSAGGRPSSTVTGGTFTATTDPAAFKGCYEPTP